MGPHLLQSNVFTNCFNILKDMSLRHTIQYAAKAYGSKHQAACFQTFPCNPYNIDRKGWTFRVGHFYVGKRGSQVLLWRQVGPKKIPGEQRFLKVEGLSPPIQYPLFAHLCVWELPKPCTNMLYAKVFLPKRGHLTYAIKLRKNEGLLAI